MVFNTEWGQEILHLIPCIYLCIQHGSTESWLTGEQLGEAADDQHLPSKYPGKILRRKQNRTAANESWQTQQQTQEFVSICSADGGEHYWCYIFTRSLVCISLTTLKPPGDGWLGKLWQTLGGSRLQGLDRWYRSTRQVDIINVVLMITKVSNVISERILFVI